MRWLFLLLLASPAAASDPLPPLSIELVAEDGEPIRTLKEGEVVERGALVRFVVNLPEGDYLHLLQRTNRGINALYPSTGLVWMRPDGVEKLVPQPPYLRDEERLLGFNGEDDGEAEYLLVVAPTPRPVPADSWLPDLETFLAPPPYVRGPVAEAGKVVATAVMVWGDEPSDPTQPREGEDEPEEGAGDDEPDVGVKEVGGQDDPNPEANRGD